MGAVANIDDEDFMSDLDKRLSENAPELRHALSVTREGQEILGLVKEAREIIAAREQKTRASRSRAEREIVHEVRGDLITHAIVVEREESWPAVAGEYRVTLNGAVIWQCPFAKSDEASSQEAEEGAALFAATVRDALSRGKDDAP